MKNNLFFVFLIVVFMTGCSSQTMEKPPEFPLQKGTIWIYSYESYDPSPSDPAQIIKATYQLTETIVEVETISTYLVAHLKREYELIKADKGWSGDLSGQPDEIWYVVNNSQVFQSNQPLDTGGVQLDELIFDYEFPLSVSKSWCLLPHNPQDSQEITGCDFIGKREVTRQSHYETSSESFNDCYDLTDYFNGGNVYQKFCDGVGIVYMKFDHAGTRFGFEQTLISYSAGVP